VNVLVTEEACGFLQHVFEHFIRLIFGQIKRDLRAKKLANLASLSGQDLIFNGMAHLKTIKHNY
jgi:hypothetical protein